MYSARCTPGARCWNRYVDGRFAPVDKFDKVRNRSVLTGANRYKDRASLEDVKHTRIVSPWAHTLRGEVRWAKAFRLLLRCWPQILKVTHTFFFLTFSRLSRKSHWNFSWTPCSVPFYSNKNMNPSATIVIKYCEFLIGWINGVWKFNLNFKIISHPSRNLKKSYVFKLNFINSYYSKLRKNLILLFTSVRRNYNFVQR